MLFIYLFIFGEDNVSLATAYKSNELTTLSLNGVIKDTAIIMNDAT